MQQLPEHFSTAPVGRDPISRQELVSYQRERVLAAATGVFAKRGYQPTKVDHLFAAAKIGGGGFYSLFEGKEDCFLTVFDRILSAVRGEIGAAVVGADGWAEQSFLGLRALLEFSSARPLESRLALVEVQGAGPTATQRYHRVTDEAVAWLRQGRRHYPRAKSLPDRFEQAAVAGLAWFLQQELRAGEPRPVPELLADSVAQILEPITGAQEIRRLGAELATA